jgi:hypothetical protein
MFCDIKMTIADFVLRGSGEICDTATTSYGFRELVSYVGLNDTLTVRQNYCASGGWPIAAALVPT